MAKKRTTINNRLIQGLSEAIHERRMELGFSQSDLAGRAGVHRTYISEVEQGSQNLTIDTLSKLADALNTTVLSLLESASQAVKKVVNQIEILLAEDNEADVHLIQRSLRQINIATNLNVVGDGKELTDFLYRLGKFRQAPLPDLILLDLNLPKKNGYEVLAEIKSHEELKRVPIVVLTTSSSEQDMQRSYSLHANCYIIKPSSQKEFQEAISKVVDYWFEVARLPS